MTQMIGSNGYPLEIWNTSFLLVDTVLTATETFYEYETPDGNTIEFTGSGLTYDENGQPTGGQVSTIVMRDSLGNTIASFTSVNAGLAALVTSGMYDFWEVVFAGDDQISASSGDDQLYGYAGDDYIYGGSGNDSLYGGLGNDTLVGGSGDDEFLWFREGNDSVDGGSGNDLLRIWAEDGVGNTLLVHLGASKTVVSDTTDPSAQLVAESIETLWISAPTGNPGTVEGVTVDVTIDGIMFEPTLIRFSGSWGNDHFQVGSSWADIRVQASGGSGDDTLQGANTGDFLYGQAGNDLLQGLGGDDELRGGFNNDTIDGGAGNDTVEAGTGDDVIYFNFNNGDDEIDGGDGLDTVVHNGFNSEKSGDIIEVGATTGREREVVLEVGTATGGRRRGPDRTEARLDDVERLEVNGQDGDDNLYVYNLAGTELADGRIVFDGGAGTDRLTADSTYTDITYVWRFAGDGHPGNGAVRFGNGDEDRFHIIVEDDAEDINLNLERTSSLIEVIEGFTGGGLSGGLTLLNVEQMVFEFAGGNDQVTIWEDLSPTYAGTIDISYGDGFASLSVFDHQGDIVAVSGNDGSDFTSGNGDDTLIGGDGNDYIFGGAGNDSIVGGDSDDVAGDELFGGDGDDTLEGGTGYDELDGGAGADRFVLNAGFEIDVIFNFEAGPAGGDVIDFSGLGIAFGDLAISIFNGQNTRIDTPDGDTLFLDNVLPDELDPGDFLF